MIKTVKNYSLKLAKTDALKIERYLKKYNACKNLFYNLYWNKVDEIDSFWDVRSDFIETEGLSVEQKNLLESVPAKLWKLALAESLSNLKSTWFNFKARLRKIIYKNKNLKDEDIHYLNSVLKNNGLLKQVLVEKNYRIEKFSNLDLVRLNKYLNRIIRNNKFKKLYSETNTYTLESVQYAYKEEDGNLWIGLSTLEKNKRLWLRLTSKKRFEGNIKVRLEGERIEVIGTEEVVIKPTVNVNVVSIDKGFVNCFTTSNGNIYGKDFNKLLIELTEKTSEKNKKRNKLRALVKKYEEQGNYEKAKVIKKNNLGKKKYKEARRRAKARLESFVNHAINQFIKEEKPKIVPNEDLSFVKWNQDFGKKIARWLNAWLKGFTQKRVDYKCNVKGIETPKENAAYTSKECSGCGSLNTVRQKLTFKCKDCTLSMNADHNAARNILKRYYDDDITLRTPYTKVKVILASRLLENRKTITEPTRTLDSDLGGRTRCRGEDGYQRANNQEVRFA